MLPGTVLALCWQHPQQGCPGYTELGLSHTETGCSSYALQMLTQAEAIPLVDAGPGQPAEAQVGLSAAAAALELAQTDAAAAMPLAELQPVTAAPPTGGQQGATGPVHQSEGSSGWGRAAGVQTLGASQLALPAQPVLSPPSAVANILPVPPSKASLFRQQVESSDSEGPLPSIDSGPSDEDEDMDNASS